VRRDRASFVRSFMFKFMEHLVTSKNKELLTRFEDIVKESKVFLMEAGYDDFIIQDFQDVE
jgi:hypothetical protein